MEREEERGWLVCVHVSHGGPIPSEFLKIRYHDNDDDNNGNTDLDEDDEGDYDTYDD